MTHTEYSAGTLQDWMSLEKEGWFQAAPMSLDTSPLLYHPQRGHDGMLGTTSLSLPHPAAAMAGGDCRRRDCRGSPGSGWIGGRVGAAGLQSLSPIGFPWLLSSLRGQVSRPSSPLLEMLPVTPPTHCDCQTRTLHLPRPSSALPGSGQLVCGWPS